MHRVLERFDFMNPNWNLDEALGDCFRGASEAQLKEAREIFSQFIQSPMCARLRKAKVLKREIAFVLNERHGLIHGVIDLLFQDASGSWHVLDYKTALGDPEKVSQAGYDLQIQIYATAVAELLGEIPVSGSVYFLKNQWEYRVDFDAQKLGVFGEHLKQMQDSIVAYRNQRH